MLVEEGVVSKPASLGAPGTVESQRWVIAGRGGRSDGVSSAQLRFVSARHGLEHRCDCVVKLFGQSLEEDGCFEFSVWWGGGGVVLYGVQGAQNCLLRKTLAVRNICGVLLHTLCCISGWHAGPRIRSKKRRARVGRARTVPHWAEL